MGTPRRRSPTLRGLRFCRRTPAQSWWLGYLDTGVADLVAADATKVAVYVGWPYVLLEGGQHALNARRNLDFVPWHSTVPELVFPSDRFWLVSTLSHEDWRGVGGPAAWSTRCSCARNSRSAVSLDEDAMPPGHASG